MRRVSLVFIATFVCAAVTDGNVPIVVETGNAKRHVMKLCSDASEQLRNGDVASAKRNINEALRIDPKLWPALYVRAEIFAREGKYELPFRIVMTRCGKTGASSMRPCCAPTSTWPFGNTQRRRKSLTLSSRCGLRLLFSREL